MFPEKKKKKSNAPFRVNLLFFAVFAMFSILVLRLGVVQIVKGEDYKRDIEKTEDVIVSQSVPRGRMFDRNGAIIVDNTPKNAITYTNYGVSAKEMLEVAEKLALLIDFEPKRVQERDKKDYWLTKNLERGDEKVPEEERKKLKDELDQKEYDKKVYDLKLERITEEDLAELTEQDLEIIGIYAIFSSGYALTPQIVKNEGVTDEEFAIVSENLQYLPGVDTTTDWDRTYSFDKTLRTILGGVTNTNEGLPKERLDYFLARDYSLNDRVGKSYLEAQYEDVLHGQKAKVKNITDKTGNTLSTEVVSEGQRGKDLVLSIDMDLQLEVEKIIEKHLTSAKQKPRTGFLDRAFVVMMDPNTGEVLSMAGKQLAKNEETGKMEMQDFAAGTITTSYNVGSSVKGATILTGFQTGAITPNTYIRDTPIKIKDTPLKGSYSNNLGTLDPVGALRVSSNVYMFHTAIRMAGARYEYNQPLRISPAAFDTMRQSFSQFGLGTRTGIDLPNEQIGFKGEATKPGFLLDLSIGQYDTYTPMQLAQYVSTIANGGNRVQARLVKEIREPIMEGDKLGPLFEEIQPTILNRLDLESGWMETVQNGFRQVATSGTASKFFAGKEYLPAGKTGTAQAFYDGPDRKNYDEPPSVINLSFVGYAPYNKPEVAIAVIVPWAYTGQSVHQANLTIGEEAMDAYFNLKKQREEKKMQNVNSD
ncbi:peptidoglycan D,D-transpeptidase FtsI family protein [Robertmurraya massiliosenegalensis]|uniref:peptidoglycan D,D-transpeptidase FtsI family protein n=1 Tax=Robertmurraya massiliosenegalensis TaxID=1287657 RepID=UPI0002FA76EE|nr:penicillin-binding protein 2 [Robertmurraya massiliosenegalensis]